MTLADVTKLLNDKKQARQITGFSVSGVPRGSRAEIFLLALVFALAQRARWGTEADIVTAIDWPPTSGGAAPQGRVTVRIDRGGAASAELIATGPVPAVAQTTVTAGVARLTGDFGFESVTGWGANPTKDAAEISVVIAAFDLLKTRAPQNVSALAGVQLIRVPSLGSNRAGRVLRRQQCRPRTGHRRQAVPEARRPCLQFRRRPVPRWRRSTERTDGARQLPIRTA